MNLVDRVQWGIIGMVMGAAPEQEVENGRAFRWTEGNKRLRLVVHNDHTADTFIHWVPGPSEKGATTKLYQKAKDKMLEIVRSTGTPIEYSFTTENGNMVAWARTNGREIFAWQDEYLPPWLIRALGLLPYSATTTINQEALVVND